MDASESSAIAREKISLHLFNGPQNKIIELRYQNRLCYRYLLLATGPQAKSTESFSFVDLLLFSCKLSTAASSPALCRNTSWQRSSCCMKPGNKKQNHQCAKKKMRISLTSTAASAFIAKHRVSSANSLCILTNP